jgi:hypothetical protein
MPTSADVHLYADTELCTSERPLLYADCEGFEGGERPPIAQVAVDAEADRSLKRTSRTGGDDEHRLRKLKRSIKRKLRWAVEDTSSDNKSSRRGFAVSEMYPKIFYAFSDVIVFVLNNPK